MLTAIVPATASTKTQNAPCLSCLLSRSVFIVIEPSTFARTHHQASFRPPDRRPRLPFLYALKIHVGTQHEAMQSRLAHNIRNTSGRPPTGLRPTNTVPASRDTEGTRSVIVVINELRR